MITFREFYNRRDSQPIAMSMRPASMTGMNVMKDFKKEKIGPVFSVDPRTPNPYLPKQDPVMLPSRRPIKDRPVEHKPGDFLRRKSAKRKLI